MTARQREKLQRWLDLLVALLVRQRPWPFEEFARDVPAYRAALEKGDVDALKRMFERDKDELRAFGVPIESVNGQNGTVGYRLRHPNFYLPYLELADAHAPRQRAKRIDRYGYHGLRDVVFEPDELAAIAAAAARAGQLGDASLAAHAASAQRKLSVDLDFAISDDEVRDLAPARDAHDAPIFDLVAQAVEKRKQLDFDYRSMERDVVSRRRVQPWGLFFLGSAWYLAAWDIDKKGLRNFRLSRMRAVDMNRRRLATPDFEVPETFDLRQHAQSDEAWQLGDTEAVEVVVRFTGSSGYVESARRLGTPGDDDTRLFRVRRRDVFARWLLTFAGDAEPLSPPDFVEQFRALVRDTLALYTESRTGARATA